MKIESAKIKSVPFPTKGFQKWDVITPKDLEYYGKQYVVTDYRLLEYQNGKVEYMYLINSIFGEDYEYDLDNYEKLYSQKRTVALDLRSCLKDRIDSINQIKSEIQKKT